MKIVVAGPRDYDDYDVVVRAIEASDFDITELVHGDSPGVDKIAGRWAEENNIPVKKFPAKWKDMTLPGAVIKTNKYGQYNSTAGLHRNDQMAEYGDGLVCIDLGTPGTSHMAKKMAQQGKVVFRYDPRDAGEDDDWGVIF